VNFRQDYWSIKQVDAYTTPTGALSARAEDYTVPVNWWSNDVARIGGARSRPGRAEEISTSAKIYAKRTFALAAPTSVQLGLDWSEAFMNRRYGYQAWRFVGADGKPSSPDDSAALIGTGSGTMRRDPTYGSPEPAAISVRKLYQLYQEHPSWFRYDAARSERLALTTNSAYDLKEVVTAPYFEAVTRIGRRLRLVGGVRYERTTATARGLLVDNSAAYLHYADGSTVHANDTNPASARADGRLVVNVGSSTAVDYRLVNDASLLPTIRTGSPVFSRQIQLAGNAARAADETIDTDLSLGRGTLAHTRAVYHAKGAMNEAENDDWFPSLHASFEFSKSLTLQTGYARTQGRIEYSTALLPNNQVTDDLITSGDGVGAIGRITLQNPNLRPWTADNFEARLTWHAGRSLMAIGGFLKQVRNFQPQIDTTPLSVSDLESYAKLFPDAGLGREYEGYSLRYRSNAGSARLDGIEAELRTPLDDWLPGWTRVLDLTCSASYLNRTGANGDELGLNRTWIGSANLRYSTRRWSIRLGYRFNGAQLMNSQLVSNGRSGQTIREPLQVLDATVEYTIRRSVRIFIASTNLTNELSVDEQRFREKPTHANLVSSQNIGTTCAVGLAGSF
jgi:TonB-dependent receptor